MRTLQAVAISCFFSLAVMAFSFFYGFFSLEGGVFFYYKTAWKKAQGN
jgi:hypothetical protein